ncbi:MAG: FGGY family carbohydrate kinase [Anaerolineae bacterium]|jgi:sugar (pentulose or hexulose) kinase|nr:FGGY family carbohydrate kinase [Anaerolineae bacterium]
MSVGRQLLLGLDVGTTATKAVLFDLRGRAIASASQTYPLITPQPGWVEQDPEDLWNAVVATIRVVAGQTRPTDEIVALSQASQGGTTIPVDADGLPVYGAISWMDERGTSEAEKHGSTLGLDYVRTTTGWPLGPTLPLQHIAWLRLNRPAKFAEARRFSFVNDFITARLTHEHAMDPSNATMTQLFGIAASDWDERLLEVVGIGRSSLSPIRVSGTPIAPLCSEASEVLGLARNLIVVNGAHDQYCAAVGTGVLEPGKMLLSGGTAWVLLAVPNDLGSGLDSGMAVSCHAIPGRFGAIRSLGGVGASLEWLTAQVYHAGIQSDRVPAYAALDAGAAQAAAGSNGVLFYPLAGGHAPKSSASGGFVGLTLSHTRGDMARAAMEGIACELRWAIEEIRSHGVTVDELTMVGGASESPVWPQIVADITHLAVTLPAERQAAARGAAVLAGTGAGVFTDAAAGFAAFRGDETQLKPRRELAADYDEQFERYRSRYDAVRSIHH